MKYEEQSTKKDTKIAPIQSSKRFTCRVCEWLRLFTKIRRKPSRVERFAMGVLCVLIVGLVWWFVTRGASVEERTISRVTLPSPTDIVRSLHALWFDRALMRSIAYSIGRILGGFLLAVVVGFPLGVLAGVLKGWEAFFQPVSLFLRYEPIAALIPLTLAWFGTGEEQKVMFIFMACVGFVMYDTCRAIDAVEDRFLDTGYTLGARRHQVVFRILVPLALPEVFNSLRLLLGLAFGYIILAEVIDARFGLGYIIQLSQRRGPPEHIYAVLFVITLIAFLMDRMLFWTQRKLFPYKYEG